MKKKVKNKIDYLIIRNIIKMSVYKLYKEGCDDFYIGSCRDIKNRMRYHKTRCNNPNDPKTNVKVYQFIRDNGGWDEWKHEILIYTDIVNNPEQLRKIEQDMINKYKPTLNGKDAYLTHEKRLLQQKQYQEKYKERKKVYALEKIECEFCGFLGCRSSLRRHQKGKNCKNFNN